VQRYEIASIGPIVRSLRRDVSGFTRSEHRAIYAVRTSLAPENSARLCELLHNGAAVPRPILRPFQQGTQQEETPMDTSTESLNLDDRTSARARDMALAARVRRGDQQAFAELHRLYHRRVLAFAQKRLGDAVEAEDVAQDVFLHLFRSIGRYEGRSSLATWILGIAHHEVCNRFRRRSVEAIAFEDEAHEIAAPAPSPDQVIDAARALRRCAETLERAVSPAQRKIFALRYGAARSVDAIARETGRSTGAVRIGLLRSRRALDGRVPEVEELLAS
jgi:RNA polymerase sigma-70 factor (ECF subfamily)